MYYPIIFTFLFTVVNSLYFPIPSISSLRLPNMLSTPNSDMPSTKLINYPKLNYHELTEQDKYDLQWYVIGKSIDFSVNIPKKARIWNTNYVVWRSENDTFIGLNDVCPHKGASLSGGKICSDYIVCPYHGYEFNTDGALSKVPGISFQPSPIYDIPKYKVVEKNGWVYLNTRAINKSSEAEVFVDNFYIEPEVSANCSMVQLNMDYNCYSRILSENSLDVMHIAFVHTFGNAQKPGPYREDPPKLVGKNHYKTTYYYEAGEDSAARKVFGIKDLVIENEFILPHTTVARVIFGEYVSTVITFALPLGDKKSRLFVKTYRNFWQNSFGDAFTRNSMYNTMLQDRVVVEAIDSRFMDGKFNMKFDKLQNVYKSFYKRFIHKFDENE
uniref:Rieske domain-containing protein n=1 Tax=viral metagenome TaxID=1070528 RepID=A0A6C0DPW3_9ZZZZ